jgi:hypothetical protein
LNFATLFNAWLAKPLFAVDNPLSTFVAERWLLLFAEFALGLFEADHFEALIARFRRAMRDCWSQSLHKSQIMDKELDKNRLVHIRQYSGIVGIFNKHLLSVLHMYEEHLPFTRNISHL